MVEAARASTTAAQPLLLLEDKIYGSACLRVRLDGQNAIENESGMKENAYDMIYE